MSVRTQSVPCIVLALLALTRVADAQCETGQLLASDAAVLDVFGWSVDVEGDLAVVGAVATDEACPMDPNCNSGAIYLFERTNGGWVETIKLIGNDVDDRDQFGHDVAISGDRILTGAHTKDEGAAYIFVKSGGVWVQEQKLTGSGTLDMFHFGHSVALQGDTAVVGTMRDTHQGGDTGSAYVFARVAGVWVEIDKLVASDAAAGDRFGRSSDIDGDVIIIGAHLHDEVGADSGAAYAFEHNDQGTPLDPLDDTWDEITKLIPADAAAGDLFGRSISIDGDTALIGASMNQVGGAATGTAYIFEREASGWVEVQMLQASDGEDDDRFGISVALQGGRALIGARLDDDGASNAGAVYVFERTPGGWIETDKLIVSGAGSADLAGDETGVALSGDTAIVSARFSDAAVTNGGAAYIYELSGCQGDGVTYVPAGASNLENALAAAVDGDTLVLESGVHSTGGGEFVITDKDLRLVGEQPAPTLSAPLRIQNLGAGKSVVIGGLLLNGATHLETSPGAIRFQDCATSAGMRVDSCSNVVIARTALHGADDNVDPGLRATNSSSVALYDCDVDGAAGALLDAQLFAAMVGSNACEVASNSFLYAAGTTFDGGVGGAGGIDANGDATAGGAGGHGLVVDAASAIVLDCVRAGAAGGSAGQCLPQNPGCVPASDGAAGSPDVTQAGGTLDELVGSARRMTIAHWTDGSNRIEVTFEGQAGDLVFFPAETTPDFIYDAIWQGVWAQPQPAPQQHIVVLPPSGTITMTVELPGPTACERVTTFLQPAFIDTSFDRWLGSPVALVRTNPPLTTAADFPTTCSANVNSTGAAASIAGTGSPAASLQSLELSASDLPLNQFGYFLMSKTQTFIPLFGNSQGNLCVGSPLVRFAANVLNSGQNGTVSFEPDFDNLPNGAFFEAGDTWFFQYWYRDQNPTNTSNTTEALIVQFCP